MSDSGAYDVQPEFGGCPSGNQIGAKKLHTITEAGQLFLDANKAQLDPILARIDEAKRSTASQDAPQVLRAMENLKLALRLRLGRGPLTAEQIKAVAAVLDAAATAVEGT